MDKLPLQSSELNLSRESANAQREKGNVSQCIVPFLAPSLDARSGLATRKLWRVRYLMSSWPSFHESTEPAGMPINIPLCGEGADVIVPAVRLGSVRLPKAA